MKCASCDASINDGARCSECSKDFGFCCAAITEQGYRKLGVDRRATWRCLSCKRDGSPCPPRQIDFVTIMDELREIKQKVLCLPGLVNDVNTLKSELAEVKESCEFTSNRLDDCSSRLSEVERKLPELESLQDRIQQVCSEVSSLKNELARNDQALRVNNVEIRGVPLRKDENLFSVMDRIGAVVGYRVDKSYINYIARVPMFNSKEKSIVVSFTNRYVKEDFIASARIKKSFPAGEIGFQGISQNVYVNDHLTPMNKKLLTLTKSSLKAKGFIYIWVKYCKIHVRKDDNSRVYIISSERDLNKLL